MNKFLFELVRLTKVFLRTVYSFLNGGEVCVICGKRNILYPVCKNCLSRYFDIEHSMKQKRCSVCGKIVLTCENVCFGCREGSILKSTDLVYPLFPYRLWNKELMFMWKSLGVRSISDIFADFVFRGLRCLDVDIVVPVPPRAGKIKTNGWDQIDELCKILKFKYGFRIFPVLKRDSVIQQKKLDREGRIESIGKAYSLVEDKDFFKILKHFHDALPLKVCLIDDVCTTGATLECCAQILKKIGINKVFVITIFNVK